MPLRILVAVHTYIQNTAKHRYLACVITIPLAHFCLPSSLFWYSVLWQIVCLLMNAMQAGTRATQLPPCRPTHMISTTGSVNPPHREPSMGAD